jgi:hypothetical protein
VALIMSCVCLVFALLWLWLFVRSVSLCGGGFVQMYVSEQYERYGLWNVHHSAATFIFVAFECGFSFDCELGQTFVPAFVWW